MLTYAHGMHGAHYSEERVPDVFRELAADVRSIARLLNDYLRVGADLDEDDSPASMELADEVRYADDQIKDPVRHVILRAHHSLIAVADHLLGLAACIEAEDVALASMSLLRPIVTAAGMAFFLFDNEIDLRERLRRGLNFELESMREQLNGLDGATETPPGQRIAQRRYRYLVWAQHHGYGKQMRKERYGQRKYWLTDAEQTGQPPSDMKLAELVLASVGDGELGHSVYRFTSAFIHTQAHAFTMFLPADMQHDPQTPGAVPLGVSVPDLTTWLMVAIMAVHLAVGRAGWFFGWDMTEWATIRRTLSTWSDLLYE